ncbi:transcriptional regulator XRE family [Candidatus Termititenax persephonae]|uniref:Transcriptional regulator XRE family n=1 Tax=Candidatus Termititenax persephonae TaxID=2218525 RepID=A0A388TL35_9BACT|nr:transcriptional regulator XRE family [Candidatus Termititenax persephonae]
MLKTREWDVLNYLGTEKDVQRYLKVALETGEPDYIVAALGNAAKARRLMGKAAKKAGVTREGLYKSLSKKGTPGFGTVLSVINSLGYKLTLVPA